MYQMSEEERAERSKVKALHAAIRGCGPVGDRYRNLAWGFVRGFPYRRIERNHHVQMLDNANYEQMAKLDNHYRQLDGQWFYEHNMPSETWLFDTLKKFLPELKKEQIVTWMRDMSGAIPPPPPRPKRTREEAMAHAGV